MEEDMEKQVSSLDNLYDDFDDFDLGQIVEKLKEETKMLKNCINEQNKDIDKLANTIVELKTTNEKLSDNISSLYSTAKAEIERKNKIIADLQREKDNLTFRRMERYNQNITSSIPQNKNIGLHSETSEHLESQNNTVVRVKQEITDNEHVPKYNSNIYGNTEGNTHMLNMFQERNKQDRNLFNNNNSELHVPYFDNESDSRQSKKIDTNLRIKKRSRSRSWDNKDYGNARQKMKSIDRSPDRSDRSNVNNWHKHHRRDSSNDRRRDKFYDQRRSKSGHRRDKSDHRRDKSNHRYKEERDEFVDGSKRDYLEDTFPRRFDSKSDNSYGRYERSTYGKINYCSPEIKTEQSLNDLKSHKSTKGKKKMLKIVDIMQKQVTNITKSPTPPYKQPLKLSINDNRKVKNNHEKNDNQMENLQNSESKKEIIKNEAYIDKKNSSDSYSDIKINHVLDNIMENVKYKHLKPRKTYPEFENQVVREELTLMKSRYEKLRLQTENIDMLKIPLTCTNDKVHEANIALCDKNKESIIKTKDENILNDSFDNDSIHSENESNEMKIFIETTKTNKTSKLNVDEIFGTDSLKDVISSNEPKFAHEDNKNNITSEINEKSNGKSSQHKLINNEQNNIKVNVQQKICNNNCEDIKNQRQKNKDILQNLFGDESTDIFGEDEDMTEFQQLVQNGTDEVSKSQDELKNKSNTSKSKLIIPNETNKVKAKDKKRHSCSFSEDSYEDNKKIKRKKCREDTKSGNSDKKILENNCDEKQNSTIITGTTDIALNKNRELIKYTKDLDNINLTTPVESLNNKFEILKPQQKYKKSLYKETAKEKNNIDKINQKDKKEDLKLDNKHNAITENVSVDDVLNSGEIHQSIKSNPNECDKLENMKEHENENKSDKIIIVSDIMILPNTLSNQDPRENKIQFEKVEGESKEVNAKMGSPKLHLVKMNSSKLISDKEILDESGSKEITNFDGGNSKELGENTLDQICEKEITSSDHNEVEKVIPYEGNVQHCKKKLSDEVNPPKERTHNLDSLEDQHSSLNSEKDISQDNIDKIESPQSTPSRKSSVNAKNKMSHPPTRRSQRISCKEMKKINTSIEENDDQKVKNDTLKDKTSFVKNVNNKNQIDTMQVKATDSKINSEDQKSIIEQLVNERIKYLNINKTEQHGNDISPGNIVPNTSKILHTKTGNKLSPVNTPTDKNSLSQTVLQNESIEKVCTKQIISSPVSLNKTPENNKEVTKTRRRITPTPVKDDPVCSFKNILSRNNTMKLFSKTVAIETNLTEENNIPILHLEEINLSNMEEGTQKTFDKSIAKLLDCMNVSNLDCDISTASLSPKVNLTFENIINTNTDPPADLNSKAAVDRSIEAVPEEITPKKQFSTRLVSSTPKVERQTSQTIGFGKDIASTDQNNVPSTNVGSDEHCKVTNNQIDKKVPCKNVNRPGRFRRRCRIIAVIKDGNQWRLC